MMRKAWQLLVPGYLSVAAIYLIFAIWNVSASWRPELSALQLLLGLLNLYSWDYQQRHNTNQGDK